jgi:hypothetical protein
MRRKQQEIGSLGELLDACHQRMRGLRIARNCFALVAVAALALLAVVWSK